jgi:hypothetical protein
VLGMTYVVGDQFTYRPPEHVLELRSLRLACSVSGHPSTAKFTIHFIDYPPPFHSDLLLVELGEPLLEPALSCCCRNETRIIVVSFGGEGHEWRGVEGSIGGE